MNEYRVVYSTGGWNRFKALNNFDAKAIAKMRAVQKNGRAVSRIELLDEIGRPVKEIEVDND